MPLGQQFGGSLPVEADQKCVVDAQQGSAEIAGRALEIVQFRFGAGLDHGLATTADDDALGGGQDCLGVDRVERLGARGALNLGLEAGRLQNLTGPIAALSGRAEVKQSNSHLTTAIVRCSGPTGFV